MAASSILPIQKAPTLVEQVSQQLALMLRSENGAANGKLMAERALASQLGVSRNVLREATKRLELQGLVEIRQGHGTRIINKLHKPLTAALNLLVPEEVARMQQLFELRLILEPQGARLAARRASEAQLLRMSSAQERLRVAQTLEDAVAADMDFHRVIAEASGNQILLLVIESLADLLAASHYMGFRNRSVTNSRPVEMHQRILAAIKEHDAEAAAMAMGAHIEDAGESIGLPLNRELHIGTPPAPSI